MAALLCPSLYQVNTRVWLNDLSRGLGRPATLDDVPDDAIDQVASWGFDYVWLLSVWQTGLAGQQVSRANAQWRREFQETLPDLREEDIPGSGFAITGYDAHQALGGDAALSRLRARLARRGLKLMLDFVPNHTALDHPWVASHPEYFITGTELDLARAPGNFTRVKGANGDLLLAHGRDPYFPGWPDTLQLNYGNPQTQEAMTRVLEKIAAQCDGVRCDMAMLVLPEVFERTWGVSAADFWPRAIHRVRRLHPGFCFLAEVYWDLEWRLQQQGFDYTYDKRLYDRLHAGNARLVREHLLANLDYQARLARFLENHDEPRAAATFSFAKHQAAAAIAYLSPGLRFFHQGQFEGRSKRMSPHLGRAPVEPLNAELKAFYQRLLALLKRPLLRQGQWCLLENLPAWRGNHSCDAFVNFAWHQPEGGRLLVAVNFAPHQSQCRVRLPFADLSGATLRLRDQLSSDVYERDGEELTQSGLYLDMRPWQAAAYEFSSGPLD
jgi:hypothetical protein